MPLYEYQCEACGHRFEIIRKFSDPPVETCPSCGGAVRKLVSSPAIQFKGTGWYVTDYARKDQPREAAGSNKADSAPEKSESTDKSGNAAASPSKGESASTGAPAPAASPAKT